MLTDQQLTETAIRFLDEELDALAACDINGPLGEILCRLHCDPDCSHDVSDSAREIETVHAHIKDIVARLRADLTRQAEAHGITLPHPAN